MILLKRLQLRRSPPIARRRRRDRHDRRSVGQERRAQPARRRDARAQPRRHPRAARACSTSTPDRRGDDEQRGLDARRRVSRVPARRRQVPDDQLHDGEGLGAAPARGRAAASATPSSRTCCCRRSTSCSSRKAHNCRLQVGGTDQYGNITAGSELQAQDGRAPTLFGLTAPLLDRVRREDGQDVDGRAHLARRRAVRRRSSSTITGSTSARTPRRACCGCSRCRRSPRSTSCWPGAPRRTARSAPRRRELARAMTSWVHGADASRSRHRRVQRDVRTAPWRT